MNEILQIISAQIGNHDQFDFIRGQCDCREGKRCSEDESESYKAGFGAKYALEQQQSASEWN